MPWAPCNGTTSTRKVGRHPPNHSTLQWHPAMAPSNGTTSTPASSPPTIAHYNGTQQWHHVHSPKVGCHPPPNHTTLQWHPTMAPSNGTTSPKVGRQPPPLHPHYNGNVQWHPAMAPRPLHPAMAPWCHVQSAKVVRRSPPLLEVRTPIAIAIWGKSTS